MKRKNSILKINLGSCEFGKRGSCCNPTIKSNVEIPDVSFGPGDEDDEDIQTELAH